MSGYEANFDTLIGPSHNFSGLALGNIAALANRDSVSHPKAAALQGLRKMKALADLGLIQGVLPPQERPHIPTLQALGFSGSSPEILIRAGQEAPRILAACSSAASMYTANAATISPSSDCGDGRFHITIANLSSGFHRAIEAETTWHNLSHIFADRKLFVCHKPLPPGAYFADEGSANHNRFCRNYDEAGVQLFVYGRQSLAPNPHQPKHCPARQSLEASQSVARLHQLDPDRCLFIQQNPEAIDAGVFHNDVISVTNKNVFLYHEDAFVDTESILDTIASKVEELCHIPLIGIRVPRTVVSLEDAVTSYLFNSQIISLANEGMALIAPSQCQEMASVATFIDQLVKATDNPINQVLFLDLKESMKNGGGPACLRLRVVLTEKERQSIKSSVLLNAVLYEELTAWVERHYRESLNSSELTNPELWYEGQKALKELGEILDIPVPAASPT